MQNYPPSIPVDAGPLIALYRQRDTHHSRALAGTCRSNLFTTWPVLTEAAHFLNERGRLALLQGLERSAYNVIELGLADVPRMGQILAKYPGADLADASLVIAAERLNVTDLATLDRTDFSIYRTRTGRAFINQFWPSRLRAGNTRSDRSSPFAYPSPPPSPRKRSEGVNQDRAVGCSGKVQSLLCRDQLADSALRQTHERIHPRHP